MVMKEVYEKLLENLANMTPEQKVEEWEALKSYNDIGPEVEYYLISVMGALIDESPVVAKVENSNTSYSNSDLYLAA